MQHPSYDKYRDAQIDKERTRQIVEVFTNRKGIIDGVEFDLTHKELLSDKWMPPLFEELPNKPLNAPFIWFPWYGTFDRNALWQRAQNWLAQKRSLGPIEKLQLKQIGGDGEKQMPPLDDTEDKQIELYIAQQTPECYVFRGDSVLIDHVESRLIRDATDSTYDREVREAYLKIRRANGNDELQISTPIVYKGILSILDYNISTSNFDIMVKRMFNYFGIQSLNDFTSVDRVSSDAYLALRKAFAVAAANKGLDFSTKDYDKILPFRAPEREFHDGSNVWYTINDAMMMGYLWAKHEVDPAVKAHAADQFERELKEAKVIRTRVKASRRAATDTKERWHKVAAKIVEDLIKKNPNITNAELLQKLLTKDEKWSNAVFSLRLAPTLPSPSSLEKFISQYQKDRKLEPEARDE